MSTTTLMITPATGIQLAFFAYFFLFAFLMILYIFLPIKKK